MRLYTYWRSSSAYRVRIALNLKELDYELVPVHLVRDGGEHHHARYRARNPQGLVPTLEHDERVLTQSLAIIEYLEETHPQPPLLPADAAGRARVRAMAQLVACEIQPLNNLRVLKYLHNPLQLEATVRDDWYRHWLAEGFAALEALLADDSTTGTFCHGDAPTLADVCLIPQVYNALRYECDLEPYPLIGRVHEACEALPAFARAAPENQPDAS